MDGRVFWTYVVHNLQKFDHNFLEIIPSFACTFYQLTDANKEVLTLQLRPTLPAWLFPTDTNAVTFTFLGNVQVTYHNAAQVDTWHLTPRRIAIVYAGETETEEVAESGVLKGAQAEAVRNGRVRALRVFLE